MMYITGVCWFGPEMPFTATTFRGYARDRQEAEVKLRAKQPGIELIVWGDEYRSRIGYHIDHLWRRIKYVLRGEVGRFSMFFERGNSASLRLNLLWYSGMVRILAAMAVAYGIKVMFF